MSHPQVPSNQIDWTSSVNMTFNVEVMKDERGEELGFLPKRSNPFDSGLDLYSAMNIAIPNKTRFNENHRVLVDLKIKMEIPAGLGLFIWDRSGISVKHGLHRVAGVVDSGYTKEVRVALVNLSNKPYHIKKGDRIAQGILSPIILAKPVKVDSIAQSNRGGFGSTGV